MTTREPENADTPPDDLGSKVAVVVSPRERWSLSVPSLEAVLAEMPEGAQLIYIDGGAPNAIAEPIARMVADAGGLLIRRDCILSGNESRNLAIPEIQREYVVFVDNDVVPGSDWTRPLVARAEETGAAAVGPLILHGAHGGANEVHIAGGFLEIEDGVMVRNERSFEFQHVGDPGVDIKAGPSRQLEFHSILVRKTFLDEIYPLDEELMSFGDHEDVTLLAAAMGLPTWFEPASTVTYLKLRKVEKEELGYWQLRWSEEWNRRSLERAAEKWDVAIDEGWPSWAALWGAEQRSRWAHGRNLAVDYTWKVWRRGFRNRYLGPYARAAEDRLLRHRGRKEQRRRDAVFN